MMIIECPKCEAAYKVNESKLPDSGTFVVCQKCQNRFFIKRETRIYVDSTGQMDENSKSNVAIKTKLKKCPRCNLPQEGIDKCQYCGFVFEKKRAKKNPKKAITEKINSARKGIRIRTRSKVVLALIVLIVFTLGIGFYFTPYYTVHKMRKAAINKDSDAFSDYVDYPSIRESLKANFNAFMAREMAKDLSDNPFKALGAAFAATLADKMVEAYVTPESLAMMMSAEKPEMKKSKPTIKSASIKKKDIETSGSYTNFNRFVFSVKKANTSEKPVDFIFKRDGIVSWKLCGIQLPLEREDMLTASSSKPNKPKSIPKKPSTKEIAPAKPLIIPILSNKRYEESNYGRKIYEDSIWFDVTWDTTNLKKPTRAVKGVLIICDIFGEPMCPIKFTINHPMKPGGKYIQRGVGFNYNQFKDSHKWVRATSLRDMTFKFEVSQIIYQDSTREEF